MCYHYAITRKASEKEEWDRKYHGVEHDLKGVKCVYNPFCINRVAGPNKSSGEDHDIPNSNIRCYLLFSKKD